VTAARTLGPARLLTAAVRRPSAALATLLVTLQTGSPSRANSYLDTVPQEPLRAWLRRGETTLYAVNLDYGAFSRQRGIMEHVAGIVTVDPGGEVTEIEDPREPDFRYQIVSRPLRLYQLQNVRLHTPTATPLVLPLAPDQPRMVGLTAGDGGYAVRLVVRHAFARSVTRLPDGVTWIPVPRVNNYYHWLIEYRPAVLRALAFVASAGLPPAGLVGAADLPSWARESLPMASLPLHVTRTDVVEAGSLVLTGMRGFLATAPSDVRLSQAVSALAPRSPGADTPSVGQRVVISRRRSSRYTVAEATLEQLLAERGFTVVVTEDLTLRGQVDLFAGATVVVGAHGAGLANALWMAPGTAIVEWQTIDYFTLAPAILARAAQLRYHYVDLRSATATGEPDPVFLRETAERISRLVVASP